MNIYTSYYGNPNLPKNALLFAVSAKIPCGFYVKDHLKNLAPSWDIYNEYKQSGDAERYTKRYKEEILAAADKETVSDWLNLMMYRYEMDAILLCYEKPGEFCHRHLIAEWLGDDVKELED